MRVGIFGGTFDPVHYGHLLLAETCREQCRLDQVRFLPASIPPHKQTWRLTPADRRVEMLRLAIAGHEAFVVSELEIARGGITYTVDTLTALRELEPRNDFFFLMGADSLRDLGLLAGMVPTPRLQEIRRHQVQMPLVEFSSTAIRQSVAAGRSIRYQTPRAVEKYIQTQGLYRDEGNPS